MKNNEPSEYYISHFNRPHGLDKPNGPLYGKMINDLNNIQSAISEWPLEENSTKRESDLFLSRSEVIEKLGKIESGVAHWLTMAEAAEYDASQEEGQDRQDECEAIEVNRDRVGRGLLFAKAMLATNQNVLWAALCLLYINREKCALRLFEECVDSVTAIPPVIRKCFRQLGVSDEKSIREAMKQGCL